MDPDMKKPAEVDRSTCGLYLQSIGAVLKHLVENVSHHETRSADVLECYRSRYGTIKIPAALSLTMSAPWTSLVAIASGVVSGC